MDHINELPALATPKELSAYTRLSLPTLARRRAEGKGPRFVKLGDSVRYKRADVEAWIEEGD